MKPAFKRTLSWHSNPWIRPISRLCKNDYLLRYSANYFQKTHVFRVKTGNYTAVAFMLYCLKGISRCCITPICSKIPIVALPVSPRLQRVQRWQLYMQLPWLSSAFLPWIVAVLSFLMNDPFLVMVSPRGQVSCLNGEEQFADCKLSQWAFSEWEYRCISKKSFQGKRRYLRQQRSNVYEPFDKYFSTFEAHVFKLR